MSLAETIYQLYFIERKSVKNTCKIADVGEKRFYKIFRENAWETRASNVSKKRFNFYSNKGWLYDQYIIQHKSCKQIATELDVSQTTISAWLIKHNIQARPTSETLAGRVFSEETKRKMSEARKGRFTGSENNNWHGGVKQFPSNKNHNLQEYKEWRKQVLTKDNFHCVICGVEEKLHAHHIIPMDVSFDLAFNVSNGITLCKTCHNLAHTRRAVSREETILVPA